MVSKEQKISDISAAVAAREQEVWGYELNILNFQNLLTRLPAGERPEGETTTGNAMEHAMFDFRSDVENRLLSERIEQNKSRLVLESLKKILQTIQND
jgi:hypothetical protein